MALNKKHEQKHQKLAEDICAREFTKAQKALVEKGEDEVQEAVDAIKKLVDDAYEGPGPQGRHGRSEDELERFV